MRRNLSISKVVYPGNSSTATTNFHNLPPLHVQGVIASSSGGNAGLEPPDENPPSQVDDVPRRFVFTDPDLLLPEYFIEYSVESDPTPLDRKVDKLMLDLAFSSKLSQADMPAMVEDILQKTSAIAVSLKIGALISNSKHYMLLCVSHRCPE